MRTFSLKTVFFALAALAVLSPIAPLAAEACPMMAKDMAMNAAGSCCGSACPCGMKNAPAEVDLALLPATAVPARYDAVSFQSSSFDAPAVSFDIVPANTHAPPQSSSKEKLYDLNSDYRI